MLQQAGFKIDELLVAELTEVKAAISRRDFAMAAKSLDAANGTLVQMRDSNQEYCLMGKHLEQIKKQFGQINSCLTESAVIAKIDGKDSLKEFAAGIKTVSAEYFRLRREWNHGNFSNVAQLSGLAEQVLKLQKKAENIKI